MNESAVEEMVGWFASRLEFPLGAGATFSVVYRRDCGDYYWWATGRPPGGERLSHEVCVPGDASVRVSDAELAATAAAMKSRLEDL